MISYAGRAMSLSMHSDVNSFSSNSHCCAKCIVGRLITESKFVNCPESFGQMGKLLVNSTFVTRNCKLEWAKPQCSTSWKVFVQLEAFFRRQYENAMINSEEFRQMVFDFYDENPKTSLKEAGEHFNVSLTTIRKVLKKSPERYWPYKANVCHKMCRDFLDSVEADDTFLPKILWSDEKYFPLSKVFNRQNHRWECYFNTFFLQNRLSFNSEF